MDDTQRGPRPQRGSWPVGAGVSEEGGTKSVLGVPKETGVWKQPLLSGRRVAAGWHYRKSTGPFNFLVPSGLPLAPPITKPKGVLLTKGKGGLHSPNLTKEGREEWVWSWQKTASSPGSEYKSDQVRKPVSREGGAGGKAPRMLRQDAITGLGALGSYKYWGPL